MDTYINLTPHPISVYEPDSYADERCVSGDVIKTFPASGAVARLSERAILPTDAPGGNAPDWYVVAHVSLGEPVSLPDAALGVTLIVSMPCAMGLLAAGIDRPDVVYPYGQVRDDEGRILGCRRFARLI
jgi:hypothetical protein